MTIEEEIARELYRCLYPGSVNTPDGARTPESDAAEFDRAYETWDAGREGWAPGIRCREAASRLMPLVKRAQAEAHDQLSEQWDTIVKLRDQIEEARNAWWSATEQGDNGLIYTDRIEDAMDDIWSAIGHANWVPVNENGETL